MTLYLIAFSTVIVLVMDKNEKKKLPHEDLPGCGSQNVPSGDDLFFPGKSKSSTVLAQCYDGNHLPHWIVDSAIYHVSFHLADSIPAEKQQKWQKERVELLAKRQTLSPDEERRLQYLLSEKIDAYLDAGYGTCILQHRKFAEIVQKSLLFYNHQKYLLHAWCVMPNHVHVVFQLLGDLPFSSVVHGWKSFTAHRINKLRNRFGAVWHVDSYNHVIRTKGEYFAQLRYVWNNPEKAGLRNWEWRWMCLQ